MMQSFYECPQCGTESMVMKGRGKRRVCHCENCDCKMDFQEMEEMLQDIEDTYDDMLCNYDDEIEEVWDKED